MAILTLSICEVSLRVVDHMVKKNAPGNENGGGFQAQAMATFLQEKINNLWKHTREQRKDIFEPPFDVFVNRDFDDTSRLNFISDYSRLPASKVFETENFLRLNNSTQNETYKVTSNSLGFRGHEVKPEKADNVYRIIVLGSYPAFGHAVNDNETYSRVLEEDLNSRSKNKVKYEVWNGGKQGATSIMGYSRLVDEVAKYNPDLIIWDYGWIELYLGKDMVKNNGKGLRVRDFNRFEYFVLGACTKTFLSHLDLCKYSVNKITKIGYSEAIAGWIESMNRVTEWSKTQKIPLVFLRHKGVSIPRSEYEKFNRPDLGMNFLDTSASLEPKVTEEEINTFWSRTNWLSELNHSKEESLASDPTLIFLGDAIQYNKIGYRRIGLFISDYFTKKNFKF